MMLSTPHIAGLIRIAAALSLCMLGTACSSSSDSSDVAPSDDTTNSDTNNDGTSLPTGVQTTYCSAADLDPAEPAYVLFDLPSSERFAALRSESDSLEDLSVLTQIASLASDNQLVPDSRLYCDYGNAEANGCTISSVPRSTVRDVFVRGSTLSFSVDTEDGQTTDYVIGNPDYSTASLASTTSNGSLFTLDTARDSSDVERIQIGRGNRSTVVTENPDCSGTLSASDGMTTTLSAEWTSPAELPLSLTYELCESGAAEGASCAVDTLTVR